MTSLTSNAPPRPAAQTRPRRRIDAGTRARHAVWRVLEYAALLLTIGFLAIPIVWLALTSLKPEERAYTLDVVFPPTLDNYRIVFGEGTVVINEGTARERGELARNMTPFFINSLVVAGTTVAVAVPLATMAAYAFSRYRFFGGQWLLVWMLTTQFIPAIVVAIPFFMLFRNLGLLNTRMGVIIVNMSIVLPYAVWMIKGFVDALPTEIEEAALVDGCSEMGVLWRVSLRLIAPGIIVSAVFAFIMAWNEFLFALLIGRNMRTMQVGLMTTSGVRGIMWEQMAAAGMAVMLPIFVLSLLIRQNFVNGMTMGAVK